MQRSNDLMTLLSNQVVVTVGKLKENIACVVGVQMGRAGRAWNRSRRDDGARVWRRAEYRRRVEGGCRKLHLRRGKRRRSPATSGVHRRVRSVPGHFHLLWRFPLLCYTARCLTLRRLSACLVYSISQHRWCATAAAAAFLLPSSSSYQLHASTPVTSSLHHTCSKRRHCHTCFCTKWPLHLAKVTDWECRMPNKNNWIPLVILCGLNWPSVDQRVVRFMPSSIGFVNSHLS